MLLAYMNGEKVKVGDKVKSFGKDATVVGWEAPKGTAKFTLPGVVRTRDEIGGEINDHFAMNLNMKWVKE